MTNEGNYQGNFDYNRLPPQSVMVDAIAAATNDELVPIISETDGGIIAYALGIEHATAMVRALNAAEGEYEAEMVAFAANDPDDDDPEPVDLNVEGDPTRNGAFG